MDAKRTCQAIGVGFFKDDFEHISLTLEDVRKILIDYDGVRYVSEEDTNGYLTDNIPVNVSHFLHENILLFGNNESTKKLYSTLRFYHTLVKNVPNNPFEWMIKLLDRFEAHLELNYITKNGEQSKDTKGKASKKYRQRVETLFVYMIIEAGNAPNDPNDNDSPRCGIGALTVDKCYKNNLANNAVKFLSVMTNILYEAKYKTYTWPTEFKFAISEFSKFGCLLATNKMNKLGTNQPEINQEISFYHTLSITSSSLITITQKEVANNVEMAARKQPARPSLSCYNSNLTPVLSNLSSSSPSSSKLCFKDYLALTMQNVLIRAIMIKILEGGIKITQFRRWMMLAAYSVCTINSQRFDIIQYMTRVEFDNASTEWLEEYDIYVVMYHDGKSALKTKQAESILFPASIYEEMRDKLLPFYDKFQEDSKKPIQDKAFPPIANHGKKIQNGSRLLTNSLKKWLPLHLDETTNLSLDKIMKMHKLRHLATTDGAVKSAGRNASNKIVDRGVTALCGHTAATAINHYLSKEDDDVMTIEVKEKLPGLETLEIDKRWFKMDIWNDEATLELVKKCKKMKRCEMKKKYEQV